MYLLFFLFCSRHKAPKTLGISQRMRVMKFFCYVNEGTFGKHLDKLGMRGGERD